MPHNLARLGSRWAFSAVSGVGSLVLWTVWLALSLLAVLQVYIASTNELRVPLFVQQALEERLALSGLSMTFGNTRFDPSGRILVEDVRVSLAGFEEPIMTARAIYGRIDPLALLIRRFEPLEIWITGVTLRVPAMLSLSGKSDEIVHGLDASFVPAGGDLAIQYLTCTVGTMPLSAQGAVRLGAGMNRARGAPLPLADLLARNYATASRECASVVAALAAFERPFLEVRLRPADKGPAVAGLRLLADAAHWASPDLRTGPLQAACHVAIPQSGPAAIPLRLDVDLVSLPGSLPVSAGALTAWIDASVSRAPDGRHALSITEARLAAGTLSAGGADLEAPIMTARPASPGSPLAGTVSATLLARVFSEPLSIRGSADLPAKEADLRVGTRIGPAAVEYFGSRLHRDLTAFVRITAPIGLEGDLHLGPGWRPERASARIDGRGLLARGVGLDEVRGDLAYDGQRFTATGAYARIGVNFARGSYEQEVGGTRYRFILQGRLRPLDITPWILGNWWPDLFSAFAFPTAPLAADMDLRGSWTDGRQARVFVSVDSAGLVYRGQTFDSVRGRLFVRPQFDDVLSLSLQRGAQAAHGSFARWIDLDSGEWKAADLDVRSTLDTADIARALGPSASFLEPFGFEKPPSVAVRGHLDGPASGRGLHQALHVEVQTDGGFHYRGFPLDGAAFTADISDDAIALDSVSAGFGGGRATGRAKLSGREPVRTLQFDAALRDASLGRIIEAIAAFKAAQSGKPPPPASQFVKDKSNVRLDVSVSAVGGFGEPRSFRGSGVGELHGPELGEVKMLGLLSELLRFTSLRFTDARAAFTLDGSKVLFPDLKLTGANSGITARGTYDIARGELDFRARINPFQESKSFPQKFMDAVLTPLSSVLEVQLSGTLDKPSWAFLNGPTNLFRGLSSQETAKPAPLRTRPMQAPGP